MRWRFLLSAPLCLLPLTDQARAQDAPPPELLRALLPQLVRKLPATKISFEAPAPHRLTDEKCGMQPATMTVTGALKTRTFSVLVDPQEKSPLAPKEMLARITRLAVDADGAERAYHPEDPYGEGVCRKRVRGDGSLALEGICALDPFSSAGIRIFLGAKRLTRKNDPELAKEWKDIWPLIRDKKLKSFDLKALVGEDVPGGYYLFYWKARNLIAVFSHYIIPTTRDGYPCVRGAESRHPGYFVAATSLTRPSAVRADGCAPDRYLDAEEIPFFVLPGGRFGGINVGDIVVGHLKIGSQQRIVFGVAGDTGPFDQFGEGSIAFNRSLLGSSDEVMNTKSVEALDIDLARRGKSGALAILILGGTRDLLRGNYSRENLEKVGREQFARWNGGASLLERLQACVAQATTNPH